MFAQRLVDVLESIATNDGGDHRKHIYGINGINSLLNYVLFTSSLDNGDSWSFWKRVSFEGIISCFVVSIELVGPSVLLFNACMTG